MVSCHLYFLSDHHHLGHCAGDDPDKEGQFNACRIAVVEPDRLSAHANWDLNSRRVGEPGVQVNLYQALVALELCSPA